MKIKIVVGIAVLLFSITITSVGVAGLILYELKNGEPGRKLASSDLTIGKTASSIQTDPDLGGIAIEGVSRHSTLSDCWMVIEGSVYDLTKFLPSHPGGGELMIPYCGKDGTTAFNTKDKNPPLKHSQKAVDLLGNYYLGKLASSNLALLPTAGVVRNLVSPTPTPPVTRNLVSPTPTPPVTSNTAAPQQSVNLTLTIAEVSKHNNSGDCWLIISNKVYNVTSYINQHPGGSQTIVTYCGKHATGAFVSKDKSPAKDHSSFAYNLLNSYYIGTIGGGTIASNIPSNQTTSSGTTPSNVPPSPTPLPPPPPPPSPPSPPPPPPPSNMLTLTLSQIATHNTLQDCWLIILGKVYEVTSYIASHPGGADTITKYCGKEATIAFQTKDKDRAKDHSAMAYNLLNNYLIGTLGEDIIIAPPPTTVPTPTTTVPTPTEKPQEEKLTQVPESVLAAYPGSTLNEGKKKNDGTYDLKITTAEGECRHIKLDTNQNITFDKKC